MAQVDDEDYERLAAHKWYAHVNYKAGQKRVYARRKEFENGEMVRRIYMHREILGCILDVDHRDTDSLNNQKCNLRPTTKSQNNANSRKRVARCSSIHKGVCWDKQHSKWMCRISIAGIQRYVGIFKDECDAALAYNFKAVEEYGEFARFNTPPKEIAA